MTFQLKPTLLLLPIVVALGGCASKPETPTDPALMSSNQLFWAGLTQCVRLDSAGEQIKIYPEQAAVTVRPESFAYTWWCQDDIGQFLPSDVSSHPIPEADKPGDGLIGASLEKTEEGFFVSWLTPNGPAATSEQLAVGDQIIAIRPTLDGKPYPVDNLKLSQLVWLIRGTPGTELQLTLLNAANSEPREVTLQRALATQSDFLLVKQRQADLKHKAEAKARKSLVIHDNTGSFMSPYTSDRVTAEWVNKALNANIGATAGSAVGAVAGAYAANKALESVPFGSFIGGMVGSKVGKDVGRSTAIESIGGWEYVRATSDMSFRSLTDMARYLKSEYGSDPNFSDVIQATSQIYPEFATALASSQ